MFGPQNEIFSRPTPRGGGVPMLVPWKKFWVDGQAGSVWVTFVWVQNVTPIFSSYLKK